jgi:sulfite exporter TauE/SafE
LSFGIGPCLASCGPLLLAYVAATRKNIIKSIAAYLLFSLGRVCVYLVLGLLVFLCGHAITKYIPLYLSRYIFIFAALFIIALGFLVAIGKSWEHGFCRLAQDFFLKKDGKTVIALGFVIGIIPCAPLISTVSYIGLVAKNIWQSLIFSIIFGLGTVVSPLFVLVVFAGLIPKFIREEKFIRIFNLVCGLVIIFLGLRLLKGVLGA